MNYEAVNKLIKDVISGKKSFVATEDVSKLATNEEETTEMINFIENMGILVISYTENTKYNRLTPQDEARLVLMYQMGEKAQNLLDSKEYISEEDVNKLHKMIKDKEKAFETLESHYHAFIIKTVNKFYPKNRSEFEDFYQSALMGFMDGIKEADFEHYENVLSTFVYYKMFANIQDQKERNTASNPASHTFLLDRKKYFEYKEKNDGKIDYLELAKILKTQIKCDKDLFNFQQKVLLFENYGACASLYTKVSDENQKEVEMIEMLESSDEDVLSKMIRKEKYNTIVSLLGQILTKEQLMIYLLKIEQSYTIEGIVKFFNDNNMYEKFDREKEYTSAKVSQIFKEAKEIVSQKQDFIKEHLEQKNLY